MKLFQVTGYWTDNRESFRHRIIADGCGLLPLGYDDDDIFFYGLTELEIGRMVQSGRECEGFCLTSYKLLMECNMEKLRGTAGNETETI
jgi:hypothetical protein